MLWKDIVEAFAYFFLTLLLYLSFMVLFPIFGTSHGVMVLSEKAAVIRGSWIGIQIFSTAAICLALGALQMTWAPLLNHQVNTNLWIATYFFLWVDCIHALSKDTHSYKFILIFGICLGYLFLFFYLLAALDPAPDPKKRIGNPWKVQAVQVWSWGWMGFYLGLSALLVFFSFKVEGPQIPLAAGALLLCFMNYLMVLFLRKGSGQDIKIFSRIGRWAFSAWVLSLAAIWAGQRWLL